MEYIILSFGGGIAVMALVDWFHYRRRITDAYQVGVIDGAGSVLETVLKYDPSLEDKLANETVQFDTRKVL